MKALKFSQDWNSSIYQIIERSTGLVIGKAMKTNAIDRDSLWRGQTVDGKVFYAATLDHVGDKVKARTQFA